MINKLGPFIVIVALAFCRIGESEELIQKLIPKSSSIWVETSSPQKMSGHFRLFDGTLTRFGTDITDSKVTLRLNLESVAMPPEQIMQAIFVQTALQYMKEKTVRFESDEIVSTSPKDLIIRGAYVWQGKTKRTEVPVQLVKASADRSEFVLALAGNADTSSGNVKGIKPGIWRGKAGARLVFVR